MGSKELQKYCGMNADAQNLLKIAMSELDLSARAYDRILKVSRTIADLCGRSRVESADIAEAIQYRSLDRRLGG